MKGDTTLRRQHTAVLTFTTRGTINMTRTSSTLGSLNGDIRNVLTWNKPTGRLLKDQKANRIFFLNFHVCLWQQDSWVVQLDHCNSVVRTVESSLFLGDLMFVDFMGFLYPQIHISTNVQQTTEMSYIVMQQTRYQQNYVPTNQQKCRTLAPWMKMIPQCMIQSTCISNNSPASRSQTG